MKPFEKKRLLIVVDSLRSGGISSSLLQIINELDYELFDLDLVLFHWETSYRLLIPTGVSVITFGGILDCISATSSEAKKKGFFYYLKKRFFALLCFLFGSNFVYSFLFRKITLPSNYDIGISYTNNVGTRSAYFGSNKFLIEKVKTKIKCSWLHVDYEKFHLDKPVNNREYLQMDYIVSVSYAVQRTLIEAIPTIEKRCKVFYNHIDKKKIDELKNSLLKPSDLEEENILKIISVGRLDKNKNMIDCVEIAKTLDNHRVNFKWLILGDGPAKKTIQRRIKRYRLDKKCLLMGNQENPYSLMSKADLFVSTSKTESFGLAVLESQYLKVPTFVVEYPASKEIIQNKKNGQVFHTKEEIAERIIFLALNKIELNNLKEICKPSVVEDSINEFVNSLSD